MRQYAGFGSAAESNRRYRYLLEQGQTGLSVAFDLPTQMGYDSDDPIARGEVGKVGVAIATIEDMRVLTEGLPLDRVSISMTINATASILLALYLATARERGVAWDVARGHGPERPAEGVHRAGDLHLSAERVAEDHDGPLRLLRPRRSRAGTRSRSRGTTSARPGRPRSRKSPSRSPTRSPTSRRRSRAASRSTTSRRGCPSSSTPTRTSSRRSAKFRAARSLWAEIARDRFGAKDPAVAAAALPHADGGLDAHGPAAGGQRRARRAAGAVRGARRHAVPPHELEGRGAGSADGGVGAPGAAHAAGDRQRVGRRRRGGSPGRLVSRRSVDARRSARAPAP